MLLIPRSLLDCELSLLDKQHLAISYSLHFMLLNAVSALSRQFSKNTY